MEGSVLRAGSRVRITAQLIEAATDLHLWAHSYDRDLGDVLALHSEVAGAIAQEVRVKLTPGEGNRLGSRPAVKPAAYEAYLKGRYFAGRGNLPSAIERFRESTQLDSSYAPAFSGLASALVFSANLGNSPSAELMPEARGSAHTALSLDPGLAEAHTARAIVCMFYEYDWPCADREFRLAVNLNPGDPEVHHWYAHYLVAIGKMEAGLAEIRRARESDPLAPVLNADVAATLALLGRYPEAEQENRKALELDPGSRRGTMYGDWILARQTQFVEAAARLEGDAPAERTPRFIATLGHYYGRAGNREKALRCVQDLRALSAKRYVSPYEFARVYIGLGDKDRAFEYLDKAYEARNFGLLYFKVDPEYDPIRDDPRFHALLKKIGLE